MSFSIIIPTRNIDNLEACLSSVRERDFKSPPRIIVVDDDKSGVIERACAFFEGRRVPGLKPFIFARNINLGIAAAGYDDVILLNDDTRLISDLGFSYLSAIANGNPEYGIISAGITGAVGNTEQIAQPGTRLREAKHHTLVFVCVYLRREILHSLESNLLGGGNGGRYNTRQWLDERFIGYGFDDDDMCERVRRLGLKLGIFDGCVVEHGVLESSYRGHGGMTTTDLRPNRELFKEKWGYFPGQASQKDAAGERGDAAEGRMVTDDAR